MKPIAVIGAGGFVGTRLIESLVLDGETEVRAIVRAYRSFAGLARFGSAISIHVADAEDEASLVPAIRGCSVVVNLTTGVPSAIVRSTKEIHRACSAANVLRLIHMSSAVVHGEVASGEIDDDSPPVKRHWMPYARAKAAAEIWLRNQIRTPRLQVATLRPGIVWGVRSPHTMGIIQSLIDKNAYLVDGGKGILNSIYVDNLVAAIRACCVDPHDITGFYNVGDAELVTWREFYSAFAEPLNYDIARIRNVDGDRFPVSVRSVVEHVQSLPMFSWAYYWLKTQVPDALKAAIKSRLAGPYRYEQPASDYVATTAADREMWHLQKVRHKLPIGKFARRFGFVPPVTFQEGVGRTLAWLKFLGFVTTRNETSDSEAKGHSWTTHEKSTCST